MNRTCVTLFTLLPLASCSPTPAPQVPADGETSGLGPTGAPDSSSSDVVILSTTTASTSEAPAVGRVPPVELTAVPTSSNSVSPPLALEQPGSATSPIVPTLPDGASGPATGGPGPNRPCAFHESVDSYNRVCATRKNSDGSLQVIAQGTRLNPDNGFEFTMHGGPHNFFAHGTLNAFGLCAGPFTAQVHTVVDKGVTTYELRFKEHCKIVIR